MLQASGEAVYGGRFPCSGVTPGTRFSGPFRRVTTSALTAHDPSRRTRRVGAPTTVYAQHARSCRDARPGRGLPVGSVGRRWAGVSGRMRPGPPISLPASPGPPRAGGVRGGPASSSGPAGSVPVQRRTAPAGGRAARVEATLRPMAGTHHEPLAGTAGFLAGPADHHDGRARPIPRHRAEPARLVRRLSIPRAIGDRRAAPPLSISMGGQAVRIAPPDRGPQASAEADPAPVARRDPGEYPHARRSPRLPAGPIGVELRRASCRAIDRAEDGSARFLRHDLRGPGDCDVPHRGLPRAGGPAVDRPQHQHDPP